MLRNLQMIILYFAGRAYNSDEPLSCLLTIDLCNIDVAACNCVGGRIPHPHPFSTISELVSVDAHGHTMKSVTSHKRRAYTNWYKQEGDNWSYLDMSQTASAWWINKWCIIKLNLGIYIIICKPLLTSTLELARCSGVLQALNRCQCFEISPFCGPSSLG